MHVLASMHSLEPVHGFKCSHSEFRPQINFQRFSEKPNSYNSGLAVMLTCFSSFTWTSPGQIFWYASCFEIPLVWHDLHPLHNKNYVAGLSWRSWPIFFASIQCIKQKNMNMSTADWKDMHDMLSFFRLKTGSGSKASGREALEALIYCSAQSHESAGCLMSTTSVWWPALLQTEAVSSWKASVGDGHQWMAGTSDDDDAAFTSIIIT